MSPGEKIYSVNWDIRDDKDMAKGLAKTIKRRVGIRALKILSAILNPLPLRFIYFLADLFAYTGFLFAVKQRRIALESLSIAFGKEKSKEEIRRIARDCFAFLAKAGLEVMYLIERGSILKRRVVFEGKENLDSALAKGNGVILVSAHFGNFPLLLAKLSLEGYPINAIIKPMRDKGAEVYFNQRRQKVGIRTIYSVPKKECVDKSIRALRNNELIFIPLDQNFGSSGGVFVDFFGRKAATATGPVILGMRTKAAIIPTFILRQADDTHKIIFEQQMTLEQGSNDTETIHNNVQKITNIIEGYIRAYPAEWGWIHRRWKSRPG